MEYRFTTDKRILITGARGTLGSTLMSLARAEGIDKSDLDITDHAAVEKFFKTHSYDILIHCAAVTDVAGAETDHDLCYQVNVRGTENLIQSFKGKKFVYISTDYVFDGSKGNYTEHDTPNPVNYYALTKLLGEVAVRQFPKSLCIRTSFKKDGPWPYPKAFIDQWTSADYVTERAPQILHAALMDLYGVLHIGGTRKTTYDLAVQQTPTVGKMSLNDIPTTLPRDISLDSSRWKAFIHEISMP
jgi:dTDP-4-dehydrorhamnose reductase